MTPNPYDQASRYLAKLNPSGFLRWLLRRLADSITFRGWLDTRTIPFPGQPERTCDTVACLVEQAAVELWWALVLEFQSEPDEEMFGRLLEYLGRIWREKRPPDSLRYGVAAVVVNLTGRGSTGQDLRLGQTGVRTCLQVGERNLAGESAARTLREIEAGTVARCVLPFIPLMQGGASSGTIKTWRQLAQSEPDDALRGDYGGLALVFAELAGCSLLWKEALRGWNVKQSQQVLEWQAQAKADLVLRLLERRTSAPIPPELADKIRGITDPVKLDRWFDIADEVSSLKDFRRRIKA